MKKLIFAVAVVAVATLSVYAQGGQQPAQPAAGPAAGNQDPWASGTFNDLRLRAVGPALMSGRISYDRRASRRQADLVHRRRLGRRLEDRPTPASPSRRSSRTRARYSIGTVAIDPKNPSTIWVGTGEANNQRSVGYGDGVYRSDDAGRTWRNLGLKNSEHIGRIVIDPRDSNVVYVAA